MVMEKNVTRTIKTGSLWKMWPYDKNLNQGEFELCIVLNPPLKGSHVYTCLKSSGKVKELTLEAYPTLYEPF